MKSPGGGRGRGGTVETQHDGGNVMSVSQLLKEQNMQQYNAQIHQQQSVAAAVAASQAQQLAVSQAQAHHLTTGQLMNVSAHNSYGGGPPQVSIGQAPTHHMQPSAVSLNHSQLPPHMNLSQNQMAHGQLQSQGHVQGLINAAQIISDMSLGQAGAAQMQQLSLNGQADFGHYPTNMPGDLSALGPNDLLINQEFNMQHMANDRGISMFDMSGAADQ